MRIKLPAHRLQFMRPICNPDKQRAQRGFLTVNEFKTLVVTPELLARPQREPEPSADVVRVIDNAVEGGESHE